MSEIIKEAKIDLDPASGLFGSFGAVFGRQVILELRDNGTVTWREIDK